MITPHKFFLRALPLVLWAPIAMATSPHLVASLRPMEASPALGWITVTTAGDSLSCPAILIAPDAALVRGSCLPMPHDDAEVLFHLRSFSQDTYQVYDWELHPKHLHERQLALVDAAAGFAEEWQWVDDNGWFVSNPAYALVDDLGIIFLDHPSAATPTALASLSPHWWSPEAALHVVFDTPQAVSGTATVVVPQETADADDAIYIFMPGAGRETSPGYLAAEADGLGEPVLLGWPSAIADAPNHPHGDSCFVYTRIDRAVPWIQAVLWEASHRRLQRQGNEPAMVISPPIVSAAAAAPAAVAHTTDIANPADVELVDSLADTEEATQEADEVWDVRTEADPAEAPASLQESRGCQSLPLSPVGGMVLGLALAWRGYFTRRRLKSPQP